MRIMVLGAGLVGHAIVKDLARETNVQVTAVDINPEPLKVLEDQTGSKGIQTDLQETGTLADLVRDYDLVVSAVPGFMGFETLKSIITAGKNVVDISFFPEDAFLLHDLAKAKDVTAVVDCGVAPGLCNILAGHVDTLFDQWDRYVCYVGGLPKERQWPYEYKAVFSPSDVLEEYTRPVHILENGREKVLEPLSDIERLNFPNLGTLEAFNTDGLRSLVRTINAPYMKEKTLRYPGHADLMRIFFHSGFFSTEPIEVQGRPVSPMALTSKLLFDQWRLKEGEEDLTVKHVVMEGRKEEERVRYTYDLFDRYDRETNTTSMARTTGYTCAIAARQVMQGLFSQKGICPPEYIGRSQRCYENLLIEYAERHIQIKETVADLSE